MRIKILKKKKYSRWCIEYFHEVVESDLIRGFVRSEILILGYRHDIVHEILVDVASEVRSTILNARFKYDESEIDG